MERAEIRRRSRELSRLIVIEVVILSLAAIGVFLLLVDRYERAQTAVAQQAAVVSVTEIFVVVPAATSPAPAPTSTNTPGGKLTLTAAPTRALTPTSTAAPSPVRSATLTRSPTLLRSPTPTQSPTPVLSPGLTKSPSPSLAPSSTRTHTPTRPLTPRSTSAPPTSWKTLTECDTIDAPGNYRLGTDLSASGECIKIQSSYVIFDCANHAIRGTNFAGYGVAIRNYGLANSQSPAYVEVRGCRVSNFMYGIFVESGNRLVIRDSDSSNNFDDVDPATRFGKFLGMTEGGGIRLNNTTDSMVLSNTTANQAIGIDVRNSSGILVRGNTASNNSAWGINLMRTQNSEASGNTTVDNVRKCTWGAGTIGFGCDAGGIAVQDGSNGNTIAQNIVKGRNGNGIFIKAHAMPCGNNNSIIGNTITSVLYNAVELGFCTGNKVNGNNIREGLDGVWLGFANNTEIKSNTIANMSNHGIISSNSHGNMVSGNQIINSNEGLYFYSEDYDRNHFSFLPPGDYRSHDNCLCGNTFQSNNVAVHLKDSTNNQVTGNTYQSNGRTFLMQGNTSGNNTQGFLLPWSQMVARRW